MSKKNSLGIPGSLPEKMYYLSPQAIQWLEGTVLTFIDAALQDAVQRKALKDLIRPAIWNWAIESNLVDMYEVKMKEGVKSGINKAL